MDRTPEESAEVQRVHDVLLKVMNREIWQIAELMVGNRLKGGGMRWGEDSADAVCHLRALYLSEPVCSDSFWNPPPTDATTNLTLTRVVPTPACRCPTLADATRATLTSYTMMHKQTPVAERDPTHLLSVTGVAGHTSNG